MDITLTGQPEFTSATSLARRTLSKITFDLAQRKKDLPSPANDLEAPAPN